MLILRWILQFDLAEHVKIIPIMDARGAGRGLRAGVGVTRGAGKFTLRHAGRAAIAAAAIAAAAAVITRGTAGSSGAGFGAFCGEGTQTAARRAGVSIFRMDAILLTHYHGDHIFGLPGIWQTMAAQGRTAPLVMAGPPGLTDVVRTFYAVAGPLPFELRLKELPDCKGEFEVPAGCVQAFPLKHRVPCCGYAFTLPRAGKFDPQRADCRTELFCTHAALCGASQATCRALMDAATTDACLDILDAENLREPVLESLLQAIQLHLDRRAAGAFRVGAVLFSNQAGPLGQTETAAQLLQSWQKKEQ